MPTTSADDGDDIGDTRDLLAEQVAYYEARAQEYDRTAYGEDLEHATRWVGDVLDHAQVRGRVLELACGTGMWTVGLAARVDSVHAVDAAEGPLEVARARCADHPNVTFERADVMALDAPAAAYDTVFMGFWLSHVPADEWAPFLRRCVGHLRTGGQLLIVDQPVAIRDREEWHTDGGSGIAVRTLGDGRRYRIVKHFVEPERMEWLLAGLGLVDVESRIEHAPDGQWVVATGRHAAG